MPTLDDTIAYVTASMYGPEADAWLALAASNRTEATRTVSVATGRLDLMPWQGTATGIAPGGGATTRAWPRSGVVVDGVAVDSTTVPNDIEAAAAFLAVALLANPSILTKQHQGSNIRRADAGGGTGVEFFSPTSPANGTAAALPPQVMRLVSKYLATPIATGLAAGGSSCAPIGGPGRYSYGRPT